MTSPLQFRFCRTALGLAAGLLVLAAVRLHESTVRASEVPVTYNGQIAPILYQHCTSCHHDGGSAPFSLMKYSDARRWGGVVKDVTTSRYMPPWLPSGPHDQFADDRRLTSEEIALLRQWVDTGMVEGEPRDAPPAPIYTSDWQLGPPDLVLEMESPATVPASGTDLFRNYILPVPLTATRWVRAMEIKPGSAQVVHHANLSIDRAASLRRAHPSDWKRGIPGMDVMVDAGESFDPDSHFLYWKPDSSALVEPPGLPWRFDPGNDLILNMHLTPSGKPETVRARIGLYFTPAPARQFPILLQLEDDSALKIPAGQRDFAVEDQLTIPEDVDVLAIYPHAHYLGKRLEGWADLPGGQRKQLIVIESWDIDRQAIYRYRDPVFLPAHATVHMRYTYDNSSANPHNPNSPPIRVTAGNRSVDEMGHLWLQVLPRGTPNQQADQQDRRAPLLQAWMQHRLQKDPNDPIAMFNLASLDMSAGDYKQSAELYRRTLAARPTDVRTMTALASALNKSGDWQQASALLRRAIAADATYADAHYDLAVIQLQHADYAAAEAQLRAVLSQAPGDAAARATLGGVLLATGRAANARAEFQAALNADPNNFEALYNLAMIELDARQYDSALAHLQSAEAANPSDPDVHRTLAELYARRGELPKAIQQQQSAIAAAPPDASLWIELGTLHRRNGEIAAAQQDFRRALAIDPANQAAAHELKAPQ